MGLFNMDLKGEGIRKDLKSFHGEVEVLAEAMVTRITELSSRQDAIERAGALCLELSNSGLAPLFERLDAIERSQKRLMGGLSLVALLSTVSAGILVMVFAGIISP